VTRFRLSALIITPTGQRARPSMLNENTAESGTQLLCINNAAWP
jgi:hypothetical protein